METEKDISKAIGIYIAHDMKKMMEDLIALPNCNEKYGMIIECEEYTLKWSPTEVLDIISRKMCSDLGGGGRFDELPPVLLTGHLKGSSLDRAARERDKDK